MEYMRIIWTQIYKVKLFWRIYLLNFSLILANMVIQLFVLHIFIQSANSYDLWNNTVIYVMMAGVLGITSSLYRVPEFSESIYTGEFVRYSVRPMKYWIQFFFMELGESSLGILMVAPIFLFMNMYRTFHSLNLQVMLFVATFFLSMILSILFTNSIYALTQFTLKNSAPRALLQGISGLLSGSLVPLMFWPDKLEIVKYLPFALIINGPIEVLLGRGNHWIVLLGQSIWIMFFLVVNDRLSERTLARQRHIGG